METKRANIWPVLGNFLVVIFFLAVLLVFFAPAFNVWRLHEGKSAPENDIEQLVVAIKAFKTDYGFYPVDSSSHWGDKAMFDFPGATHHNFELINTLRADGTDPGPNIGNAINSHETVYLDVPNVRDSTHPKSGLGTGKETNNLGIRIPGEWYDFWGNPYLIAIDLTGKGISDLRFIYSDAILERPANVICIMLGRDGKVGSRGNRIYNGSDDIVYPRPVQ